MAPHNEPPVLRLVSRSSISQLLLQKRKLLFPQSLARLLCEVHVTASLVMKILSLLPQQQQFRVQHDQLSVGQFCGKPPVVAHVK